MISSPRGPLLALVLPLLTGIVTRRFLLTDHSSWWPPGGERFLLAAGLVLLFLLLFFLVRQPPAWWLGWLPGVFLLGLIHPGLPAPSPPEPGPGALRERIHEVEPLRQFREGGPSSPALGIGRLTATGERLYFVASPPEATGYRLRSGYAYPLLGVLRPLREGVEDREFARYLEANGVFLHLLGSAEPSAPATIPDPAAEGGFRPARPVLASPVAALFGELRQRARALLSVGVGGARPADPGPAIAPTAVYRALVLGDRTRLGPEARELFRQTGTAHLFAISGLHLGLIATFLYLVFRRLERWAAVVCTGLLLLFYLLLVGAPPSAVRAFFMVMFLLSAFLPGRRYNLLSAVAASATLVLLLAPRQVFSAGFQFSYTVVIAIAAFGVPLARRFRASYRYHDPQKDPPFWSYQRGRNFVTDSTAVSLAAVLGSLPLTAQQFGILPLVALPLNLLLLLPVMGVLGAGLLSVLAGLLPLPAALPAGLGLSALLNEVALLLVRAMVALVETGAGLPGASLGWDHGTSLTAALALVGTLAVSLWVAGRPRFRPRYLLLPLAVLGAVLATGSLQALLS